MTILAELEAAVIKAKKLETLALIEQQKARERGIVEERTEPEGIEVEYRAGYLIPVEHKGRFDAERDRALIEKGSHFYCLGHLEAVVIEERSRNLNYCSGCYRIIQE